MVPASVTPDRQNLILLGRVSENKVTEVHLPCQDLGDGTGSYSVFFQRPGAKTLYAVNIRNEWPDIVWRVMSKDTAKSGTGRAEVRWYGPNEEVGVSVSYYVRIEKGLLGNTQPPDGWDDYAKGVVQNAEMAKAAAGKAEEAQKSAKAYADAAERSSSQASEAASGARASKEAAEAAKNDAQQAQSMAQTSETNAGASASAAAASASAASGYAADAGKAQEQAIAASKAASGSAAAAGDAKATAVSAAETAQTAANTAMGAAVAAGNAQQSVDALASQVRSDADKVAADKAEAQEAAGDALGSQQEAGRQAAAANEAATSAGAAADRAAESKGQAETARAGAEAAKAGAEEAAQGVAADRAQIGANTTALQTAQQELTATKKQLAETKTALEATQKDLAKAQRAIQFQAELSKGQTWDFETDTQEAYQRTVPSGAKAGAVMAVGGKTVGWNQLLSFEKGNISSNAGPSYMPVITHGDVATGTIARPINSNGFVLYKLLPDAYDLVSNHTYLMLAELKYTTAATQVGARFQHGAISNATVKKLMVTQTWQDLAFIGKMTTTVRSVFLYIDTDRNLSIGDTIELRNPLLVDLTLLYGPGNEPTTTDDPRIAQIEAYAAAHPEFNAGELVSALVDEVRVMGVNILRPSGTFPVSKGGVTAVMNQDGTITINGTSTGYPFFEVGRLQLTKGTTYFIPRATRIMQLEDGNRIVVHNNNNNGFTPDKDYPDVFLEYTISPNETYSNTVIKPIVSVGARRDYSPYTLTTLPIPDTVKQLPGYGWSAGSVANTVERTENGWQYVQRVESVDLGTLDYVKEENTFRAKIQDMQIASTDVPFNGRCKSFIAIRYRDSWTVDGTMSQDSAKRLVLIHSGYSNIASFLSYVRGTSLYYELDTPITTDITDLMGDALAPFSVEAGGSITLHHPKADDGLTMDVPAKIQYITKLSEVSANG